MRGFQVPPPLLKCQVESNSNHGQTWEGRRGGEPGWEVSSPRANLGHCLPASESPCHKASRKPTF